ncbi:MAG TPA: hypothetical protein VFK06_11765 [Candidatus Angelobacter sp.]|nr:hypothetical protein [Candidatus Angelobacter sp.]
MPLTVGILIIGSLLWDERRQQWRDARLNMASMDTVTAPIRYGRLSSSRGNTYTMVFSRLCEPGQAKLVTCSHTVSSLEDLLAQAEHLWKAEQLNADQGRIAVGWGCVALLFNPERKIPEDLLKGWADRVGREADYGHVSQTEDEGILVSEDGLLQIAWPRLVKDGTPVQLDLLLATANDPGITATSPRYPEPETIANAWNAAASKHTEYFWKNLDNGIRTFQDEEIRTLLLTREPR